MRHGQGRLLPALPVISELSADGDGDGHAKGVQEKRKSRIGHIGARSDSSTAASHHIPPTKGERYRHTHFGQGTLASSGSVRSLEDKRTTHSTLQAALDLIPAQPQQSNRINNRYAQSTLGASEKPLPLPPPPRSSSLYSTNTGTAYPYRSTVAAQAPGARQVIVPGSPTCPQLVISDYDYDYHLNRYRREFDQDIAVEDDIDIDIESAASTPIQTPVLSDSEQLPQQSQVPIRSADSYRPVKSPVPRARTPYHTATDSNDSAGSEDSDDFAVIRYVKDPHALKERLAALSLRPSVSQTSALQTESPLSAHQDHESLYRVPNARRTPASGAVSLPVPVLCSPPESFLAQPANLGPPIVPPPPVLATRATICGRGFLYGATAPESERVADVHVDQPRGSGRARIREEPLCPFARAAELQDDYKGRSEEADIMKQIAILYAILAVLAAGAGQVGGMTLRQRQETVAAGAAATGLDGAAELSPVAVATTADTGLLGLDAHTSTTVASAAATPTSAATSASGASVADTENESEPSSTSATQSNSGTTSAASGSATSLSGPGTATSSGATAASVASGSTSSTSGSASASASADTKLENPSNPPAPAPGGMAFILPAFVIIGCIFIVWLIHNIRIYLYKIKEIEEQGDTQSPDPSHPLPDLNAAAGGRRHGHAGKRGKEERRWKKRGWKELGSEEDDYTDDEVDEKYGYDHAAGRRGSYRDREEGAGGYMGEGGERRREQDGNGEREKERGGSRHDKYSRTDDWQGSRKYRGDRQRTRTKSRSAREAHSGAVDLEKGRRGADERKRSKDERAERKRTSRSNAPADPSGGIQTNVDLDGRSGTRDQGEECPGAKHARGRREIERYRRAPDAYEDEFDERYLDLMAIPAEGGPGPVVAGTSQQGQLKIQMGPHQYRTASREGTPVIPPSAQLRGASTGPKLTVEAPTPVDASFPMTTPAISSANADLRGKNAADAEDPASPTMKPKHTARHAPLNLRARAASPPPVLSPPMNPMLFFHDGPSTTHLNAAAISTDGSGTDLSSIGVADDAHAQARRPQIQSEVKREESIMPTIPSSADKLGSFDTPQEQLADGARNLVDTPRAKGKTIRRVGVDSPRRTATLESQSPRRSDSARNTPIARTGRKAVPTSGAALEKRASRRDTAPAPSPTASPAKGSLSAATLRRAAMRELQERVKAQDPSTPVKQQDRRKSRGASKDEKARGQVQAILRESWSERAVVGSVAPISGLADGPSDDDGDDDEQYTAETPSRDRAQRYTRPLSPRNVPLPAGGVASPGTEDVGRLGGIEQRFAAIRRTEGQ